MDGSESKIEVKRRQKSLIWRKRSKKCGQTYTEYAVIAAIILVGGMATIWLFGKVVLGVLSQLAYASAGDNVTVDKTEVVQTLESMEQDSSLRRNMDNFDERLTGEGL